jgi:hypothetical protein
VLTQTCLVVRPLVGAAKALWASSEGEGLVYECLASNGKPQQASRGDEHVTGYAGPSGVACVGW